MELRTPRVYQKLPCGCVVGSLLCPEAERLWAEVGAAYRAAMRSAGTWDQYEEARAAYARHFWEQGVYFESDLDFALGSHFRGWLKEYGHTLSQEVDHGNSNCNAHER